ncbi:unnamed protein product [Fraxinus pennsylvanica]|uniref:Uncharacterized protein n=1 Tax=Fraxinus pennsylvanica TaxID=56036 RepID=A0AAD2A759_9LAMI|nr:unnamed protein product [Fraxinus pennsylvanica]
MPLGPIIPGTGLSKNEIVRSEYLSKRAGSHGIHSTRLEVHENGARDIPVAAGLIIVDVDTLELEFGVAVVLFGVIDAVLVTDDLPELGANLVTTLAALNVKDFSHFCSPLLQKSM